MSATLTTTDSSRFIHDEWSTTFTANIAMVDARRYVERTSHNPAGTLTGDCLTFP